MSVFAPYIAFENWTGRGLILEVVMQERMLATHVRSVLNQLRHGYSETYGSLNEAIVSNFALFRLRLCAPTAVYQARFFDQYIAQRQLASDQQEANDINHTARTATT